MSDRESLTTTGENAELTPEELEAQDAAELPDREAMSLITTGFEEASIDGEPIWVVEDPPEPATPA